MLTLYRMTRPIDQRYPAPVKIVRRDARVEQRNRADTGMFLRSKRVLI